MAEKPGFTIRILTALHINNSGEIFNTDFSVANVVAKEEAIQPVGAWPFIRNQNLPTNHFKTLRCHLWCYL